MIYKHKKTGNYYETFDFVTFINATNAQADEEMIAYVKLPLSEENKTIFVRKKSEFYEKFERGEDETE